MILASLTVINNQIDEESDHDTTLQVNLSQNAPAGGIVVKYQLNEQTATAGMDFINRFQETSNEDNPLHDITKDFDFASVAFIDINNDGNDDVLVGHFDGIAYYRNTGDSNNLNYVEVTGEDNPFNSLDASDTEFITPAVADIDNDGDLDVFFGSDQNKIIYFENQSFQGSSGFRPVFNEESGTGNPLDAFNVGTFNSPTFGDVDNDGDADLLVGNPSGIIRYYENTGIIDTNGNVVFEEKTGADNPFTNINVVEDNTGIINENSSIVIDSSPTLADVDNDGDLDLFVGERRGVVNYYENLGFDENGQLIFDRQSGPDVALDGVRVPSGFSKPIFFDIDNDNDLDAFVGQNDGGVVFFENTGLGEVSIPEGQNSATIKLTAIGDLIAEDNETFEVTLVNDLNNNQGENNYDYTISDPVNVEVIGLQRIEGEVSTITLQLQQGDLESITLPEGTRLIFTSAEEQSGNVIKILESVEILRDSPLTFDIAPDFIELEESADNLLTVGETASYETNTFSSTITIIDNDIAEVKITTDAEGLNEIGANQTFSTVENDPNSQQTFFAVLTSEPTAPVEVFLGSSDLTQGRMLDSQGNLEDFSRLVFTPTNWNTPQSFTLTPIDNDIDEGNVEYEIISTVNSDDTQYREDFVSLKVAETYNPNTQTIGLQIDEINILTTTLNDGTQLIFNNGATAIVNGDFELSNTETITVSLVNFDDSNATGSPETTSFTENISPEITIIDADNDEAGVIVNITGDATAEGFSNNFYSVQLASQPLGEVLVIMTPDDNEIELNDEFAGEPLTFIFDENNWDIPREVQVTAVDDFEVEYRQTTNITFSTTGEDDPAYDGLIPPDVVEVIVEDNDLPIVTVESVAGAIEGDAPGYFLISLDQAASDLFGETGLVINYSFGGTSDTDNTINFDGNFNVEAFYLEETGDDIELNSTSEVKRIWDSIFTGTLSNVEDEYNIQRITPDITPVVNYSSFNVSDGIVGEENLPFNNALNFDGVDDFVSFEDSVNISNDYTIEGWFKSNSNNRQSIVALTDNFRDAVFIELGPDPDGELGELRFLHRPIAGGSEGTNVFSGTTVNDNIWHHFAAVRDGNDLILYVDGNEVSRETNNISINNNLNFRIGRLVPNLPRHFDGSLDEIRIWNTARTQEEIQDNLFNTLEGNEQGLTAYYQFDDASGTIFDQTNNNNDGVFQPSNQQSFSPSLDINEIGDFANSDSYNSISNSGNDLIDHFSVRANAILNFTEAGTYTIAVGSNDGRLIQLKGTTFTSPGGQITSGVGTDTLIFEPPTGHRRTLGTFTVTEDTLLELNTFFWDRRGSDSFEISIAEGEHDSFNTDDFQLLENDVLGIQISSQAFSSDLQLPPNSTENTIFSTRIAPGESNSPLIAFPIDDFIAEGVDLKLTSDFDNNDTSVKLRINDDTLIVESVDTADGTVNLRIDSPEANKRTILSEGVDILFANGATASVNETTLLNSNGSNAVPITINSGTISNGEEVFRQFTLPTGSKLTFGDGSEIEVIADAVISSQGTGTDVSVSIPDGETVSLSEGDLVRLPGETVTVTVQAGDGYVIDATASQATLEITDNDTPGVRIVEFGDVTTVTESETTELFLSLTSQPEADVTVNLTPVSSTASLNVIDIDSETGDLALQIDSSSNLTSLLLSNGTEITFNTEDADPNNDIRATVNEDALVLAPDPENPNLLNPTTNVSVTVTEGNSITVNDAGSYTYEEYSYSGAGDDGTLSLTFNSNNWFQLQTVTIEGIDDNVVEKEDFHTTTITYDFDSFDPTYDGLEVAPSPLNIIDRTFERDNTINSISQGFLTLQDSLDNLTLPVFGSLDGLAPDFITIFTDNLAEQLRNTENITYQTLTDALNTALGGAFAEDGAENTEFTVEVTELASNDIAFLVDINAEYNGFDIDLGGDLGLSALGIGIETQGGLESNFNYDFSLGFGISEDDGFYINTEDTAFTVGANLGLGEDFQAIGNLGFLRLDFSQNELDSTGIDAEFVVTLTDPDGEIDLDPDGDITRLTLNELQSNRGNQSSLFDFIEYGFTGDAALNFDVKTSIQGNSAFPSFSFNLASELPLFNYSNQEDANDTETPQLTIVDGFTGSIVTGKPFKLSLTSNNDNSDTRLTKGTELIFKDDNNDTQTLVILNKTVVIPQGQDQEVEVIIPVDNNGNPTNTNIDIDVDEIATIESSGFNISFNEITLDLGTFISDIVSPVIEFTNDIIDPVKPVVDALTANVAFLSDIGIADLFDQNDDGEASLVEVAAELAGALGDVRFTEFVEAIIGIIDLAEALEQLEENIQPNIPIEIPFGDYTLENFTAASESTPAENVNADTQGNGSINTTNPNANIDNLGNSISNVFTKLDNLGVEIPLLDNPLNAINLFLGQNVDLINYDIPDLSIAFELDATFPIVTPFLSGVLGGSFGTATDLEVGFDTDGFRRWQETGFDIADSYLTLDGFFINDLDEFGQDKDELVLAATLEAGAEINAIIASATVTGGIRGEAGLDIVDVGEYNNTSDGRIRTSEIFSRISNPLSLFEFSGSIDAFLRAIVKIGINLGFVRVERTVYDEELATVQLFEFTLGGDRSGTVSQSYIEGAQVFFDANSNGILDEGEPFTYTDSNGDYDLDVPLVVFDTNENGQLDNPEGRFVAIGGIDTTSRLAYSSPFYSFSNWGVVTPLTTLAYQIWDLGSTTVPEARQLVLQAFGLADKDIDLNQFDPIEALEEGDITGLEVYTTHIQVQSMLELTNTFFTEFLEAGGIIPNRAELSEAVIEVFAKHIIDNPNPDIWTDAEALLESYTPLLTELIPSADDLPNGFPIDPEDLPLALEAWSEAVAKAFKKVDQAIITLDTETVLEKIVPTKILVQEDLVNLIGKMGSGASTPGETITALNNIGTPTDIEITNLFVSENAPNNTLIGQLTTIDPDLGDSHTYALLDNPQGRFKIVGDELQVADASLLDFETDPDFDIRVQSTDNDGLSLEEILTVNLIDDRDFDVMGTSGDDLIASGTGGEVITGLGGKDTYIYDSINDFGDVITDFNANNDDLIDLKSLYSSYTSSGLSLEEILGTTPFEDLVKVTAIGSNAQISVSPYGQLLPDYQLPLVTLEGVTPDQIDATDFLFS